MTPDALAARWRDTAVQLRSYGAEGQATALEHAAAELEDALAEAEDELLTPSEAAEHAGVTERTLRTWRADGRIENHGTDGRPLYRRGDLPKAGTTNSPDIGGYSATADAAEIMASR